VPACGRCKAKFFSDINALGDRSKHAALDGADIWRKSTTLARTSEGWAMSKAKRTKKWLIEEQNAEEAVDEVMERILERDGIGAYEAASGDFLTGYCNTIVHMDGSPERLLGMLRRLEAMYGARQRDGGKVANEVRRRLTDSIAAR
jgi:hypothetical protein